MCCFVVVVPVEFLGLVDSVLVLFDVLVIVPPVFVVLFDCFGQGNGFVCCCVESCCESLFQ